MHIVAIICKKLDSTAPFFVDTPEGQTHNDALQAWKAANQDLFVSHEVYRDNEIYISRWTYTDEQQAANLKTKMAVDLADMLTYRDTYTLQNGQKLWSKTIKADESVVMAQLAPHFSTLSPN